MHLETLRQAYREHAKKHGGDAVDKIIADHGGDDGLTSVPADKWPALFVALGGVARPKATSFAELVEPAFARWNAARAAPRE